MLASFGYPTLTRNVDTYDSLPFLDAGGLNRSSCLACHTADAMKAQRPLGDDSPKGRGFPLEMLAGDSHGSPPLPCRGQVTHANVSPTDRGSQGETEGEMRA